MDARQVAACQFGQWYPTFEKLTFKSVIIDLPEEVIEHLLQDGVYVAASSRALPKRSQAGQLEESSSCVDWEEDTEDEDEGSQVGMFPEFCADLDKAIKHLGGRVIPKLNWSCPLDATWISSSGSMLCTCSDEVFLLLKSSDRVMHDMTSAFEGCPPSQLQPPRLQLALRRYLDLRPEREFRCFVHQHMLIGISQRHITDFFPTLVDQRMEFLHAITEFHAANLQCKFILPDYTCDVYINTKGQVRLVDFNPIGGTTSPLLFQWEELPFSKPQYHATMTQVCQPFQPQSSYPPSSPPSRSSPTSKMSDMSTTMAHDPFAALAGSPLPPEPGSSTQAEVKRLKSAGWIDTSPSRNRLMRDAQELPVLNRSPGAFSGELPEALQHKFDLEPGSGRPTAVFSNYGGPISPAPSSQLTPTPSTQLTPQPSGGLTPPRPTTRQNSAPSPTTANFGQSLFCLPDSLLQSAAPPHFSDHPFGFSSDSDVDVSELFCVDPNVNNFDCRSHGTADLEPLPEPDFNSQLGSPERSYSRPSQQIHEGDSSSEDGMEQPQQQRQRGDALVVNGIEFRIVMEPNKLHQNPPRGGVPFDLVDQSHGGAVDALLARLEAANFDEAA
ncbi:hypothetical protein WJX73_008072 [Symbiochloris irregularis]|uniref:Cell division cycle protein 123 n=1 Tax=Symbiochloris irregularis TaxID=706552 RepID=A0AAW1NPJ2_9CHLO